MADTDAAIDWESEYNVRLLHPERGSFQERGRRASDSAYRELPCMKDIRYGPGERAVLDLFMPLRAANDPPPLVAFFHGGYWQAHERQEYAFVARPFAMRGIATAIVGYDLAPAATIGEIVKQARAACRWLREHAAELQCDAGLIFAAGHSAGAHLAACGLTDPKGVALRGAVLVSGIYNLEPIAFTSLNRNLGLAAASARRWSPSAHALPETGDVLVTVGAFETAEFLRQSRAFAERWKGARRHAELMVVPAAHHYSIMLDLADPDSALARAAVHRVLGSSAIAARGRSRRRR